MEYKTLILILAVVLIASCTEKNFKEVDEMGNFKLTSSAFENNGRIPKKFTCQGDNISPPLEVTGVPEEAKTLVLIVDDPDAPGKIWDHWLIWNIPVVSKIEENSVPKGSVQGLNDFGKHEYGGPCPPSGTHRYVFKLYALDTALNLDKNSRKDSLEKAMKNHIMSQTKLVGLYSKE